MTVTTMESCDELSCDDLNSTSDNELALFEEESDLIDEVLPPNVRVHKSNEIKANVNARDVGANMTFISKPVSTLISSIFKCPVSEETLKGNISLTAPKVPFLNIRPTDPWLKNVNPNLVPECLESEVFTQRFISNFLRVAFPLVNLLDAMSKGRLTQSRIETSVTDSLLLLSSALENVNSWRRENLMRSYNLSHLKNPDVSPAENPYLFPYYFEKCAKFPSVDELYQANEALPDLEINSVSKFANEVVSGDSMLEQIDGKVQKLISDSYNLQKMGKDNFSQTSEEVKGTASVGSQVRSCKCSVVGTSASTTPLKTVDSSSANSAASNNSVGKQTAPLNLKPLKSNAQKHVENGADKTLITGPSSSENNSCKVEPVPKIASPDISIVEPAQNLDNGCKTVTCTKTSDSDVSSQINKDVSTTNSPNQDFSADVFEVSGPEADNTNEGSISSGITIEDNDDDVIDCDPSSSQMGNVKEMESEIVILEVSDEAEEKPKAVLPEPSEASKRKLIPITGPSPSPPSINLGGNQNQSTNARNAQTLNTKKTTIRSLTSNIPSNTTSVDQPSFSSSAKSETATNALANRNVSRLVTPAPLRPAGSKSATAFQHAALMAGFGGNSLGPSVQQPVGGRIVRAAVDPIPFSQQMLPAKRGRYDAQWSAMEFGGQQQQQGNVSGLLMRNQPVQRGASNFPRRTTNRRGF